MENNCIVENIAFLPDEHPVYKYTNEIANWGYGGEMASRSILVDWSNIQLFNFYSGNNYNKSFDGVNYEKTILIINHINFINGRGQFIQL